MAAAVKRVSAESLCFGGGHGVLQSVGVGGGECCDAKGCVRAYAGVAGVCVDVSLGGCVGVGRARTVQVSVFDGRGVWWRTGYGWWWVCV
jgi:hypothetical protein